MHEISLYGKPHPDGGVNKQVYHFPGSWEEATASNLLAIARTFLTPMSETTRRFILLEELAGIPKGTMALLPSIDHFMQRVDVTDRSGPWRPVEKWEWQLLPQLNWTSSPPTYEKSLLPYFEHNGKRWYGPLGNTDHGFDHMTLNQWVYSTMMLQRFRRNTDPKQGVRNLLEFVAALYQCEDLGEQPELYSQERHIALLKSWNEEQIPTRADALADLPDEVQLAAVLNFEAIHSTLSLYYPKVFDADGAAQQSPQGLFGLAYDAATTGVFGDVYRTEQSHMHRVIGMMEHNLWKEAVAEAEREAERRKAG